MVLTISQHVVVGVIRDGEQVRRHFSATLSLVLHGDLIGVDRESLVGIHRHTEETRVGLYEEKECIKRYFKKTILF